MDNPIFADPTSGAAYVFCAATLPICAVITALRFVATWRSGRPFGWEDWFALGAFLTHGVHCILTILILEGLGGQPVELLSPARILHVGKLIYVLVPIFPVNQLFAKFSILWLYHRLFAIRKTFKHWMWVCGILQVAYSISTFLISFFQCSPVSKGWNLAEPGTCINHSIFLAASESVNSLVDFIMVALAIVMIQDLQMKVSTKWKLGGVFALGGLAGVFGFIKIGMSYGAADTASNLNSALWTTIQQFVSLLCCCVPIYRSLLPKKGLIRTLTGRGGSQGGATKLHDSESSASDTFVGRRSTTRDAALGRPEDQAWLQLSGSSQRGQAWTEVDAEPGLGGDLEWPREPSRTVQVKQSVDMV